MPAFFMENDMSAIIEHAGAAHPVIDAADQVCANCAFSHFKEGGAVGECRANPPTPLLITNVKQGLQGPEMMHSIQPVFPPVERTTFCYTFEHTDGDGSQPVND